MRTSPLVTTRRTSTGTTVTYALRASQARRDPQRLGVIFDFRASVGFLVRMRWAEAGFALERVVGAAAVPLAAEVKLDFLTEDAVRDPRHALSPLVAPIPKSALAHASGKHGRALHALRVFAACPAAVDLVGSSPGLLWMLLGVSEDRGTSMDEIRTVLARRRHEILGWCGGLATRAAVRYLERRFGTAGPTELRAVLRECSSVAVVRDTAQVSAPDADSAYFSMEHPEALQSEGARRALDPTTRTIAPRTLWTLWADTLKMATQETRGELERALISCRTSEGIQRLHDAELARYLARGCPEEGMPSSLGRDLEFWPSKLPRPPLPGSAEIQPLSTRTEIELEGRLLQHCCAAYLDEVRRRRCYLYRVLAPERATLEIDTTGEQPRLAQLLLARNEEPSPETRAAVMAWFTRALEQRRAGKERYAARRARQIARERAASVAGQ